MRLVGFVGVGSVIGSGCGVIDTFDRATVLEEGFDDLSMLI